MPIEIPIEYLGALLLTAAETELSVEEIIENAINNYMKRGEPNG